MREKGTSGNYLFMFFSYAQNRCRVSVKKTSPVLIYFLLTCLLLPLSSKAVYHDKIYYSNETDTIALREKPMGFTHQIGMEFRPARVIPSAPFYKQANISGLSVTQSQSGHLKYSFALPEGTLGSYAFPNTHQGIGLACYDFGHSAELGSPIAIYLFQSSAISRISSRFSLDYEWNFGLSWGWKPYDPQTNPNNVVVGSGVNAYINLGLYFKWQLARRIAMTSGIDFSHFSNGNTEFPNAGVNASGLKIGLIYDVSKADPKNQKTDNSTIPKFPRHISYDAVVFGAWRRKGVDFFGAQVASPLKYPVIGAYFAPMYNWGYRFRTGLSLDAIYDGSANVYTKDYIIGTQQDFFKPSWERQVALGFSARADYMMPIFTIGIGIGSNVAHKGGDFRGTYEAVVLKIKTSRSSFLHIGYNLKNFNEPNYLMLGLGYTFNNRTPSLLSR